MSTCRCALKFKGVNSFIWFIGFPYAWKECRDIAKYGNEVSSHKLDLGRQFEKKFILGELPDRGDADGRLRESLLLLADDQNCFRWPYFTREEKFVTIEISKSFLWGILYRVQEKLTRFLLRISTFGWNVYKVLNKIHSWFFNLILQN